MENKNYAWKVCYANGLGFYSFILSRSRYTKKSQDYERHVEYKLGKWTYPRKNQNQFLFVFKTRKYARDFKKYSLTGNLLKVFKVEIKNPKDINCDSYPEGTYQKGTILCKSVKLLS